MDTASVSPHAVPSSSRDGWRSLEHRVLKRRAAAARGLRRRRQTLESPVRDAFETRRGRPRALRLIARSLTIALAALAAADLIADNSLLRQSSWIAAVLMAGAASLLAAAAA